MLYGYGNSTPQQSRDLHFENEVTHDSYLAPTHGDGSFAVELPPGVYELRSERGAVLRRSITIDQTNVPLGHITDLAPYTPMRWFHLQDVAGSILTSPAPSTAYVMTKDPTVLPPSATTIPKPKINWGKPLLETEVAGPNMATAETDTAPKVAPVQPPPRMDDSDRPGAESQFSEPPIYPKKPVDPNDARP
jgi:hypothetical protein